MVNKNSYIFDIVRYYFSQVTIGLLYIDKHFVCHTLESHHLSTNIIPVGVYPGVPYMSPHFQRIMIRVYNKHLPNVYDEIHTGNFLCDTRGCILVGNQVNYQDNAIYESRPAYSKYIQPVVFNLVIGVTLTINIWELPINKNV